LLISNATKKRKSRVRYLTYILLGVGGLIAIAALAVVFLGEQEPAAVAPQGDTKSGIIADIAPQTDTNSEVEATTDQSAQTGATDTGATDTGATDTGATDKPAIEGSVDQDQRQPLLAIDLAQVKPDGQAVFAGQAAPGAMITVFEGDILLGETVADDNGEWVVILEKTLAPGQHLVSVAMETNTGETELADATLAIEIAASKDEQPLVAVLPQTENEVPKLLQSPDDKPLEPATIASADTTDKKSGTNTDSEKTSDTVTAADTSGTVADQTTAPIITPSIAPRALVWRENNELAISGVATGGVRVTASTKSDDFAEALVMANGDWSVFGTIDPSASRLEFRFALYDETGTSVAAYVLPVTMRDLDVGLDGSEMVVINRGDALWRIAYRSYGEGVRYVDIVRRNSGSIVDPDLIYPNQIFALPKQ
jgi:nucleoid-associated protein YgaU